MTCPKNITIGIYAFLWRHHSIRKKKASTIKKPLLPDKYCRFLCSVRSFSLCMCTKLNYFMKMCPTRMVSWLFWRPSWVLSISVEQATADKVKKISVSSFLFFLLTNQSNIFIQSKIC
jgi:hypothetical protein